MQGLRLSALVVALALSVGACTERESSARNVDATPSGTSVPGAANRADAGLAQSVIEAFERNFGVHAGERRNHTKGVCAAGEFIGDPAVRRWSRSALFSGEPVPVVARFSLPGGDPHASDVGRSPRGMALEFRLPDGSRQHMTMLNVPVFGAATPRSFLDGLLAATPDPATGKPDPERLRAYRESHPDTAPLAAFMADYRPPASYANATYFGIHVFRLIDQRNVSTVVKWQFVPEDGERPLSDEALANAPDDFLQDALMARAAQGPIRWRMELVLAEPGDPLDDPTRAWPDTRRHVAAGTLSITAAMPQAGAECEHINFDPGVMADGVAPGDDPILALRSPVYALSFARRMSEKNAAAE